VIKLTGKVFSKDNSLLIKEIAEKIKILANDHRVVIVTGGGPIARQYISIAKDLNASEAWCDLLGIDISRINAKLLIAALNDIAYTYVPENIDEFLRAWSTGKVVVLGGLQPGQSTTAVAAIIAEVINADLLIYASDVDGIYDKDPKKFPNAKKLDRVSVNELRKILEPRIEAGTYELIDPLALLIIERCKIRSFVISAFKPNLLEKLVKGEKVGTEIIPSS